MTFRSNDSESLNSLSKTLILVWPMLKNRFSVRFPKRDCIIDDCFFFFFFFFLHELSVESRIDTVLFVIQLRKQQCDINETRFCSGSTEHIFIEITKHQGRLQQHKIPLSKSHLQQHFPFLSSNF